MLNFGPATITLDGTSLGKTAGGFSLQLVYLTTKPLRNFQNEKKIAIGVTGTISKYEVTQRIDITDSLDFTNYGVLTFTLLNGGIITLYKAKLFLPENIQSGMFTHKPFEVSIKAVRDSNGKLMTIV